MSNDKHVTEELLRAAFIAGAKSQLTNHAPEFADAVAQKAWDRWPGNFRNSNLNRIASSD